MGSLGTLLGALMLMLLPTAAAPAEPPPPTGPKTESNRRAAYHAMKVAAGEGQTGQAQLDRAKELYVQMTSERPPSKWKKFATRWYERGLRGESMEAHKGGRKPTIDDDLARVIAEEWTMHGVGRGGSWRPYSCMQEVRRQGSARHLSVGAAAAAAARRCRPRSSRLKLQPHRLLHRQWITTQS